MPSTTGSLRSLVAEEFAPKLAVHESADLCEFAQSLDAENLRDLLVPFSMQESVTVRDSNAMSHTYDNFCVSFTSPGTVSTSPDLEELLRDGLARREDSSQLFCRWLRAVISGTTTLHPFETFQHPVAGILAVSSRAEAPVETLTKMFQESYENSPQEFVNADYLRYFVLVHDEGSNIERSQMHLDEMRRQFGVNTAMVRLGTSQPDANAENLKVLVHSIVEKSVIPFMNQCCAVWNEQAASSRQGFAGRLFGASKRYLSNAGKLSVNVLESVASMTQKTLPTERPQVQPGGTRGSYSEIRGYYNYLTQEAQLRKLADFSFMLRDYKAAHSVYEMLKKGFNNDRAWSYLAACEEMTCISYLLMSETVSVKGIQTVVDPLLDSGLYSYLSRCALPVCALRCIVVSAEILCTMKSDTCSSLCATKWLFRALSDSLVGPLGRAVIMERMCHAFLSFNKQETPVAKARYGRSRKAAFWSLLAAQQWQDTQNPAESERCLQHSLDLCYGTLAWTQQPEYLLGKLELLHKTEATKIPD